MIGTATTPRGAPQHLRPAPTIGQQQLEAALAAVVARVALAHRRPNVDHLVHLQQQLSRQRCVVQALPGGGGKRAAGSKSRQLAAAGGAAAVCGGEAAR